MARRSRQIPSSIEISAAGYHTSTPGTRRSSYYESSTSGPSEQVQHDVLLTKRSSRYTDNSYTRNGRRYSRVPRDSLGGGGDFEEEEEEVEEVVDFQECRRSQDVYSVPGGFIGLDDSDDERPRSKVKGRRFISKMWAKTKAAFDRLSTQRSWHSLQRRAKKFVSVVMFSETWILSGLWRIRSVCWFLCLLFLLPLLATLLVFYLQRGNPLYYSGFYSTHALQDQSSWSPAAGVWPTVKSFFSLNQAPAAAAPVFGAAKKDCCMTDHQLYERLRHILPPLLATLKEDQGPRDTETLWKEFQMKHESDLKKLQANLKQFVEATVASQPSHEQLQQAPAPTPDTLPTPQVNLDPLERQVAGISKKLELQSGDTIEIKEAIRKINADATALSDQVQTALDRLRLLNREKDHGTLLQIKNLEDQLASLQRNLNGLQQKQQITENHVMQLFQNDTLLAGLIKSEVQQHFQVLIGGAANSNKPLSSYMDGRFSTKEDMDRQMADLMAALQVKIHDEAQAAATAAVASQGGPGLGAGPKSFCPTCDGEVGEQEVRNLIKHYLAQYDADKTGMADYALESAGGSIINTRCTETYTKRTALLSVFGVPLWYTSNAPRVVLQPGNQPGQCWPFKGQEGTIVIQLAMAVRINGFTMEHMPRSLAPNGKIDSAPRDFSVLGLESEYDYNGVLLGNFTYDALSGESLQYFPIFKPLKKSFYFVQLNILNNWSRKEYTCLYRFRVHGNPETMDDNR